MTFKNKGFTLIELLVVIAIIGILSSVVLASLNSARSKGQDAAIKSNLNGIRAQAELYYDNNNNSYAPTTALSLSTSACLTTTGNVLADTNVRSAMQGVDSNNGSQTITCVASSTGWAISSGLNGGGSWCIDSSGKATSSTATASGC